MMRELAAVKQFGPMVTIARENITEVCASVGRGANRTGALQVLSRMLLSESCEGDAFHTGVAGATSIMHALLQEKAELTKALTAATRAAAAATPASGSAAGATSVAAMVAAVAAPLPPPTPTAPTTTTTTAGGKQVLLIKFSKCTKAVINLNKLAQTLMHKRPGFPELYEPLLEAIKGLAEMSAEAMDAYYDANTWLAPRSTSTGAASSALNLFQSSSFGGGSTLVGKRAAGAKVGLMNLGNTCYINSTMQALFSIPLFRRAMMHLPPGLHPKPKSAVAESQKLFTFLALTERKSFAPRDFLSACRPVQLPRRPHTRTPTHARAHTRTHTLAHTHTRTRARDI